MPAQRVYPAWFEGAQRWGEAAYRGLNAGLACNQSFNTLTISIPGSIMPSRNTEAM